MEDRVKLMQGALEYWYERAKDLEHRTKELEGMVAESEARANAAEAKVDELTRKLAKARDRVDELCDEAHKIAARAWIDYEKVAKC